MKCVLTLISLLFASGAAFSQSGIDPRAKGILDEMVRAYRKLKSLEQESVYDSKGSAAARILRTKLVFQRPNRLLLEVHERSPVKESTVRRFVSDGKEFYSYNELEGHYVKDKAPKNLEGFGQLATSIEMAAITGIDPFASIARQAAAARIEEPAEVAGVLCDVVFVDVGTIERTGEVRFYVGREDRLLRKFAFDSKPIPNPEPKEKKLLPDLPNPDEEPLPPLDPPTPVHFGYQVKVKANPNLVKGSFRWVAPSGALQLLGAKGILNQNRKQDDSAGARQIAPYVDLSNPTRKVHAKDLIEKANKQRKR